jgi:hypothetical protein
MRAFSLGTLSVTLGLVASVFTVEAHAKLVGSARADLQGERAASRPVMVELPTHDVVTDPEAIVIEPCERSDESALRALEWRPRNGAPLSRAAFWIRALRGVDAL